MILHVCRRNGIRGISSKAKGVETDPVGPSLLLIAFLVVNKALLALRVKLSARILWKKRIRNECYIFFVSTTFYDSSSECWPLTPWLRSEGFLH